MEIIYILIIIGLFVLSILSFHAGKSLGKRYMFEIMQEVMKKEKKDALDKSRAIIKGQFSEQLSPFNSDFPGLPSEARFLGAPVDFIIFKGLDEKNVEEIIFVEVKTGQSKLNKTEESIKKTVEDKKISFKTYRV